MEANQNERILYAVFENEMKMNLFCSHKIIHTSSHIRKRC